MYLRILKKELRRKKTMNLILLVFIILASMFIASSANDMVTVSTALDNYFIKADVPDYWLATTITSEAERFDDFARDNNYTYNRQELLQINPKDVTISGEVMKYSSTLCLSKTGGIKIFDSNSEELKEIHDGEIYVTAEIFESDKNDFHEGGSLIINSNGIRKEFKIKGYTKDALFGSSMVGMTRFLISENDYKAFARESSSIYHSINVYTDDPEYLDKYGKLNLNCIFNFDGSRVKLMYLMDMLTAAILLVVSICLILISMVILHFSIRFTVNEDFREIGVMKAIGISNNRIRGLYIAKYFAIALAGTATGLILSFPFSGLMLEKVAKKIILFNDNRIILNIASAVGTAVIVIMFCFFCTRKICKFSPIDAIHNGETGERYTHKGILHLNRSRLGVIPFLSLNDILSEIRRFISMILIFVIGILLVILPVDAINTLRSDNLITWFNMAECDHVISEEMLFTSDGSNKEKIEDRITSIKKKLGDEGIKAEVFQEVMFRMNITCHDNTMSSLSFQGTGDVTTDDYVYIEGSAPANKNEVAISHLVAANIKARIGDEVQINTGNEVRTYIVTAINESMNNLGESIRFYQDEDLDYAYAAGCFGTQIRYTDQPGSQTLKQRKEFLEQWYPDTDIFTAGDYISYMIGNSAEELEEIKTLILIVVLCVNLLVAVLMVKSFITKEKYEIALLKATGFRNNSLILWQTMRIGLVLLIAIILGTLLSAPLGSLIINPIFQQMGAKNIELKIIPAEVYVVYPFIIFAITLCAAFLSAQSLRKIETSEISNIE